jgi:PAS domain S-box-containing protein
MFMRSEFKAAVMVFLFGTLILTVVAVPFLFKNRSDLLSMAHDSARLVTVDVAKHVDDLMREKVKAIIILSTDPNLIDSLKESNSRFSVLPEEKRLAEIQKLDAKWRSIEDPSDPFVQEYLSNPVAQRLRNLKNRLPDEYGEIFVTNKYGAIITTTDKLTTLAHKHKYWWEAGYDDGNGRIFFDDRGYDDSAGAYVLGVVAPVMDADEIVGIVKSNIRILGALKLSIEGYGDVDLAIVRSKGRIVLEGGREPLSTKLPDTIIPELGGRESGSTEISIDGKVEIVAFSPIDISRGSPNVGFGGSYKSIDHIKGNTGEGWHIVLRQSVDGVLEPSRKLSIEISLVGTFIVLLLTFGAWLVGRKLTEGEKRSIKAHEALRESEEQYRSLVEDQIELVCQFLPNGTLTFVNDACGRLVGNATNELVGNSFFDFLSDDARERTLAHLSLFTPENPFQQNEEEIVDPDGNVHCLIWNNHAFFNDAGNIVSFQAIGTDITDRKRAEEALREARDEANFANHSKSIFLANMSHELRTPLNSINGFAEMMALETFGPLPEKYKEYAELINGSGTHLLRIINNVLDMAKIEAGKVELATEDTDMGEIIAEAVFMLGGQANDNNVNFLTEVGPTHELKVDPLRIKQALVNVISNALKFTPGGTVTVSVACDEKSHNLIVTDTGIGMTEEDIEIALKPFGQAEGTAFTRRFEGTGLGLPLAKQLVELHGGNLNVESELSVGTTVTMSFPHELCRRSVGH